MSLELQVSRGTVLIVEDEAILLWTAVDIIEEAGFDAIAARNADEAILILESRDDIRVIFTDVNMPGSMNGLRLAHAVRGRWPPIKIIVTSGYGGSVVDDLPTGVMFIPKPYKPEILVGAVTAVALRNDK
jgi:DNA-binding NtrC family response regulator